MFFEFHDITSVVDWTKNSRKHSAVSGQRSGVSGQRSVVSGQWSVVSGQWSAYFIQKLKANN
ncbi:MAG: hypothetical protein F6K56_10220 [Moorea sp. SIO3G5]|nr:hypothetical protein [Moorena sp. SIO3G5]